MSPSEAGVARLADGALADLDTHGFARTGVYVELAGQLRCVAQRGYTQVHDGIAPGVGLLGRTLSTGTMQVVDDVRAAPGYLETHASVRAEACIPVRHGAVVVGVLNVEHTVPLTGEDLELIREVARMIEDGLYALGGLPRPTGWQQLARDAATIAACNDTVELAELAVRRAVQLTGMDSAALRWVHEQVPCVTSIGPDGALLSAVDQRVWDDIARRMTGRVSLRATRSGGPGDVMGLPDFPTWAAVPLRGGDADLLVVTSSTGCAMTVERMQMLEVLGSHVGSALRATTAFQRLQRQAGRDSLTGVRNSTTFHREFEQLAREARTGIAVLLADLDGFKEVNDSSGHLVGDQLLIDVAAGLSRAVEPDGGTLYRIGGDEFVAVVPLSTADTAMRVAERMRMEGRTTRTSVSVGLTERTAAELPSTDAEEMLAEADLAMYTAKRVGRDRVERFLPTMSAAVRERAHLASDLAQALADDQLHLVYQPVVDIERRMVLGGEALMRWTHPLRGLIPPDVFIPIAEETGLIHEMGRWAIRAACAQGAAWNGTGRVRKVAVNVSGVQLRPDLVHFMGAELERTGLLPDMFVIEITESAVADDPARIEVLQALHDLGVVLAIDDFGTGYSSLSYLQRLPIDIVKIDKTFADQLDDPRSVAVVKAVIALTGALGLSCVVEGIETHRQVQQLRAMHCDTVQGYHFSPAMDPEAFSCFVTAFESTGAEVA